MDYDVYKAIRLERGLEAEERREQALRDFGAAFSLACRHQLVLRRCDNGHYQVKGGRLKWLLNVYPGNQRIYSDPHYPGRYLDLPSPWTLVDVVREVARLDRERTNNVVD